MALFVFISDFDSVNDLHNQGTAVRLSLDDGNIPTASFFTFLPLWILLVLLEQKSVKKSSIICTSWADCIQKIIKRKLKSYYAALEPLLYSLMLLSGVTQSLKK